MRSVKLYRKPILILSVVVAVAILTVGLTLQTSKPGFCNTCHEMQPAYKAWATSNHATVECGDCHDEFNLTASNLIKTEISVLRDFFTHVKGRYETPVNRESALSATSNFKNCTNCHSIKREMTLKILIPHGLHAEKLGIKCAYCHNRVGHPNINGYEDRAKMSSCIDCHKERQVSIDCKTCHPKGSLRSVSNTTKLPSP